MRRARLPSLIAGLLLASPALAQTVTADPAGSSPINGALAWVQGTLLGNLATTAAVIAVAVVGFLMLTGRIEWRRGLVVVVGCFIIFGATAIVAGIRAVAGGLH
jgi:type IV secretory pathway VirB2 component (pilin)